MNAIHACPNCQSTIVDGQDSHICPACLLSMVLRPQEDPATEPSTFEERIYEAHGIEVIRRVAEGGMGVVYEANQSEFDRRVALKILREDQQDSPVARRHFVEEGRVSGSLQHPGILPVYASGLIDDRPFFTMRLVEGRTLADLLAEEGADRERCLEHFRRVCETVAYAHSQGTIHRDLKPSNVLVGDFGEVVVIDWGLASSGNNGADRQGAAGQVVGTPAYMSPEQARGEADRVDPRSDVFGLGAILCEILTGRPPYQGATGEAIRRQARTANTQDAQIRIAQCGADEALRRLASICLSVEPAARPADAGAVALAMDAYETGVKARIKAADEARYRAEVRAVEERKRWGLVLLLLALVAGGGFWWLADRSARIRREDEAGRSLVETLDESARLRSQGRTEESRASARRVEGLLAILGEPGRARFGGRLADLEMLAKLDDARFQPSQASPGRLLHVQTAAAYAAAFRQYGIDLENDEAGAIDRVRASPIRAELVAALDDWGRSTIDQGRKRKLHEIADATDPAPGQFSTELRRALAQSDRAALGDLARSVRVEEQPASVLASLGGGLRAAGGVDGSIELLRAAVLRYPGDFWINLELAASLAVKEANVTGEASNYLTAALALSHRNPATFYYLGSTLHELGRLGPACDAYRLAIAERPGYAEAYCNLGNALTAQGKIDEAIAAFHSAIDNRPGYALAYFNLGYALDERGRYEDAADAYSAAIRSRADYAEAYCNLGLAEHRLGRFAAAAADVKHGLDLLPAAEPMRPYWGQVEELDRSLAALEPRLVAVLGGDPDPTDVKEIVGLARLCAWQNRRLFARATRLYQAAFAASPALADDLHVGDRYAAAQSAAMAGSGLGEDAADLTEEQRVEFRSQAQRWLRADLDERANQVGGDDARAGADARMRLRYWLRDPHFEGIRGEQAIGRLTEPERGPWKALWDELSRLVAPPA